MFNIVFVTSLMCSSGHRLTPTEFEVYTKTIDDWMQQNLVCRK